MAKITIERNSQNRNSQPYQSAVAFLKDLVTEFRQRGLHTAPANELQRLKDQEKADTEVEPKARRPRIDMDTDTEYTDEDKLKEVLHMKGEMSYLELMEALTKCTDIEQILRLENKLLDMGYEPNVV